MQMYIKLKDMLERELEQFAKKNEISSNSLEMIDMLTHSIKSVCTILATEGNEEHERTSYYPRPRYGRRNDKPHYDSDDEVMGELRDLMERAPEHMKSEIKDMMRRM